MRRVVVYIDGGPFTDAVRGQGMSMDMDYQGLLKGLVPDAEIEAIHFIIPEYPDHPYPAKNRNQKIRLGSMAAQGIAIHMTKPQIIGSIFIDRGVEALMTAKILLDAQANLYDTALVVSRRVELSTAIKAIKAMGKSIEIAYFGFLTEPVNPLSALADKWIEITNAEVVANRKSGPRPPSL